MILDFILQAQTIIKYFVFFMVYASPGGLSKPTQYISEEKAATPALIHTS